MESKTVNRAISEWTRKLSTLMLLSVSLVYLVTDLSTQFALADTANSITSKKTTSTFKVGKYQFDIQHPPEFVLEALNLNLKKPRVISFHGDRLFIGSQSGEVYWIDPPYVKANILVILNNYPHSVVVRDEIIYIAQTDGVYAAPYSQEARLLTARDFELVVSLPGGGGHSSRTLKLGPDSRLYVSLGIRGNCSDEYLDESYPFDLRRGGIFVIDETGDQPLLKPYGTGLRNPVGFDWHPDTGVLYASNNGPDHLGYHSPPEYFSKITPNSFHGMPWFQYDGEKLIRDPCIDSQEPKNSSEVSLPVATFPARSAPMDVAFLDEPAKAKRYRSSAIVALHGSWATEDKEWGEGHPASRRHPRLVVVEFKDGKAVRVMDLLSGFQLPDGRRWARPMGVDVGPDGHIYFTSDAAIQGLYRLRTTE